MKLPVLQIVATVYVILSGALYDTYALLYNATPEWGKLSLAIGLGFAACHLGCLMLAKQGKLTAPYIAIIVADSLLRTNLPKWMSHVGCLLAYLWLATELVRSLSNRKTVEVVNREDDDVYDAIMEEAKNRGWDTQHPQQCFRLYRLNLGGWAITYALPLLFAGILLAIYANTLSIAIQGFIYAVFAAELAKRYYGNYEVARISYRFEPPTTEPTQGTTA